MMFLVIFSSLAVAMAIVSQGNLYTADSQMRINRAQAAAETGLRLIEARINTEALAITTRDGVIDASNGAAMWDQMRARLLASCSNELHNLAEPYEFVAPYYSVPASGGAGLRIGPIAVGPGEPTFTVYFIPHPIAGEDYASAYYQRPPYSQMSPPVSALSPLDASWVRVQVVGSDGPSARPIRRAIQMDFHLAKRIRFAVLSKSRVMVGRNVLVEGPIGSRFMETHLDHGHPVQIESDFRGLQTDLDNELDALVGTLVTNDQDGDNRLNIQNPAEVDGLTDPTSLDTSGDGYIDDYDFFQAAFDSNADGAITQSELETGGLSATQAAQLVQLIDTFGHPERAGYNDGAIDADDRYAKVRGQIAVRADLQGWLDGAAGGAYQDHLQGPILADHGEDPLTFDAPDAMVHEYTPADFDTSHYRALATGDLAAQAAAAVAGGAPGDPEAPRIDLTGQRESVPYGAAHPYDYYDRPVYENITFQNVTIPKGTNALFKNCKFIGVTFVDTEVQNTDPMYNYAGMQESDGAQKHPDKKVTIPGYADPIADTKTISNNIRFDGCTFEGSVVSPAAQEYTHVRNKIAFTGTTRFEVDDSTSLTPEEKRLYKRSAMLLPSYSVELGTFLDPAAASETVRLTGTIVAGIIDMRGQVQIEGTILTTFEPQSDTGPVLGQTSPNFNTTLGYFPSTGGDLEAELPGAALGVIQLRYNEDIPLPDGILGPIEMRPVAATYFETRPLQ